MLHESLKRFLLIHLARLVTPKKDKELSREIFLHDQFHKISYCTSCKGRTTHLKKTYVKNILDNLSYPNIEFVLVNYNSNDDMDEWVYENLRDYINEGLVSYYKTNEPETYHMSKAKNLSHRLASGDILVNLDADNFLGKDNAFFINDYYWRYGKNMVLRFSKPDFRYYDTSGRITLSRELFYKINGYREDFLPYGQEDSDLLRRLNLINTKIFTISLVNFLRTIKHDDRLRGANMPEESGNILKMKKVNFTKMVEGIENKTYKANPEGFTDFNVYKNFRQERVLV